MRYSVLPDKAVGVADRHEGGLTQPVRSSRFDRSVSVSGLVEVEEHYG